MNETHSMTIQQYKDLLIGSSPSSIHLPAKRMPYQSRITETSPVELSNGFTSFTKIKGDN